jgi:hypothetical protein
MNEITVCITSYNRFDLLEQTIDSFLSLNNYPIEKIIVVEDSTIIGMKDKILSKYDNAIELIFNDVRIGQAKSIDKAYSAVNTEYILHCEDDYVFTGNPNFISNSIDILKEREDIHQIWIRHLNNFYVSHGGQGVKQFHDEVLTTSNGIQYRLVRIADDRLWSGFTWNPNIKRTTDYRKMFPNGYGEFLHPDHMEHRGSTTEALCSQHASLNHNYRGALLVNGACNNVGVGRGTY